jgi:Zn-dependent protease
MKIDMDLVVDIVLKLPAIFLAMTFHEYAHALVAYKQGDDTPVKMGRLTLAPLVHIDWIGLVMFTLLGFGWAKPVRVNPSNFKNRKRGDILVSIAGPIANLLVAAVASFVLIIVLVIFRGLDQDKLEIIIRILNNTIFLNIVFMILNLLPIPPLDGYQVLKTLLFRNHISGFLKFEKYSTIVLVALIFFGVMDFIIAIPAFTIYSFLVNTSKSIVSIFL